VVGCFQLFAEFLSFLFFDACVYDVHMGCLVDFYSGRLFCARMFIMLGLYDRKNTDHSTSIDCNTMKVKLQSHFHWFRFSLQT
jgi:hypothetical protein